MGLDCLFDQGNYYGKGYLHFQLFKYVYNPSQDEKNSALSKLKEFADKKKMALLMKLVSETVENTLGKRRKFWLRAFSFFPHNVFKRPT